MHDFGAGPELAFEAIRERMTLSRLVAAMLLGWVGFWLGGYLGSLLGHGHNCTLSCGVNSELTFGGEVTSCGVSRHGQKLKIWAMA